MLFIYPKELQPGDKLRIHDSEEKKTWWEEVDSVTDATDSDPKSVLVFTKARTVRCDPGLKVIVDRPKPEGE